MTATETRPTAACRHCGCTIERIATGWVNDGGFFACVKAPPESIGHGKPAGFVLHEPMPAGLRGETAVAGAQGRHFPSGHMTDVTGGQGGPSRHQCGGCEAPITHERGEWRSVYTGSMWCPDGAK